MCSLCRLPVAKNHNFEQFLTFLGAPVPTHLYQWGPNLVCYSRPTAYAYVPNFVWIGLFCRPMAAKKTPTFAIFSTSAFSGVASWQQSKKVEHRCTTTNLPLSNSIMAKSGAQTLDVQKRDEQTNRLTNKQTKNSTFLAAPAGGKSESHQNWHGDRGPQARSCTSKTSGVWHTISPLGGAENLGITRGQLKTITPWANPTKI